MYISKSEILALYVQVTYILLRVLNPCFFFFLVVEQFELFPLLLETSGSVRTVQFCFLFLTNP